MNFNVEIQNSPADFKSLNLSELCKFVLAKEFPFGDFNNVDVSVSFVDANEIQELNKEYRNIDSPTDVLSFEIDGFDLHNGARKSQQILDGWLSCDCDVSDDRKFNDNFQLGDIIICSEIAKQNCEKFNTSIDSEIKLLVTHGLLHLCGYDHLNDAEAEIMEAREEVLLEEWEANV